MYDITRILVGRYLREYYNCIQDALADWMSEHIDTDELETVLMELDEHYIDLIVKEFE